jgi:hypothetical protein
MKYTILGTVVRHTPSLLVGVFVFLVIISFIVFVPNLEVLISILSNTDVTLSTKVSFFFSMYGSLVSNQTLLSGFVVMATAFLSGINAAFITYYLKTVRGARISKLASLTSIGGLVAGLFGLGCAACGSILLTAILASVGSAALLLLPFKGAEFGFVGIALLLYAIMKLSTEIKKGATCTIS